MAHKKPKPSSGRSLRPMLATLIDAPFDDRDWLFETKWDGFRVIAKVAPGKVVLLSRNGKQVTKDYPKIAQALAPMRKRAVLDGELVALDQRGRSRFQLLQNARKTGVHLRYYVFDLLSLGGEDLRRRPLIERKRVLKSVLPRNAAIRFSRHVRGRGVQAYRAAARRGLEGVIAKRADGRYYSGKRTREWLKIKTSLRQEVVIVGYTRPRKSRQHFGALVLAVRQGRAWQYAGRTGTGFNAASLKTLHDRLRSLHTKRNPLREKVPNEGSTTWVQPKLVCEVKFTEWTKGGQMRHPAFVGLRSDKAARAVVRERERRVGTRPGRKSR